MYGAAAEAAPFFIQGIAMDYQTLDRESIFDGRVFRVHTDTVRTPAGATMQVDVVEHSGAVAIIAIDAQDNVLLVRQYRHPAGNILLELPAGTLDGEEDPQTCARRESREEIGLRPKELIHLGGGYLAPGYSTEFIHFFLALNLTPAPLPQDMDEDIRVESVPRSEIAQCITSGQITDVKTIAGIYLAESYMKNNIK